MHQRDMTPGIGGCQSVPGETDDDIRSFPESYYQVADAIEEANQAAFALVAYRSADRRWVLMCPCNPVKGTHKPDLLCICPEVEPVALTSPGRQILERLARGRRLGL